MKSKSHSVHYNIIHNTLREIAFRLFCTHHQADKPNIKFFCTRRSGSTWFLNILAAHPGMRYVNKPFDSLHCSRWRWDLPAQAECHNRHERLSQRVFMHFEGEEERKFKALAESIIMGRRHVYPTIAFQAPYFNRKTSRVVFQLTNVTAMIEWFDENIPGQTALLLRHPISNALSIMNLKWGSECEDFLRNEWFVDTHLNGAQVDLAKSIIGSGSLLDQHVLDWSLKMLVPIRAWLSGNYPEWTVFNYEQAVSDPELIVDEMASQFGLTERDVLLNQIQKPSRTVTTSTTDRVDDREYLIRRWKKDVNDEQEKALLSIPATFGLDVYLPGSLMPQSLYMVNSEDA